MSRSFNREGRRARQRSGFTVTRIRSRRGRLSHAEVRGQAFIPEDASENRDLKNLKALLQRKLRDANEG